HGVVGHGGVRGRQLRAGRRCVRGRAGKEAPLPGAAGVERDRGADVRGGSTVATPDLEGGDDGRPGGEAVRLDGGLVLAVAVRVRVDGETAGDDLAVGRDDVGAVGADHIGPGPAVDPVLAAEGGLHEVVTTSREDV